MDTMNYGQNNESFPESLDNSFRFHAPAVFPEEAGGAESRGAADPVFRGEQPASCGGVYEQPASCAGVYEQPASCAGYAQYAQYGASGSGAYRAPASGLYDAPSGAAARVETAPRRREKRRGLGKGAVALALCCSLLGGAVGAGGVLLAGGLNDQTVSAEQSESRGSTVKSSEGGNGTVRYTAAKTEGTLTAAEVYEQNVVSTVGITTEITSYNFWGYRTTSPASGSGFILTEDGYILTNHHVIEDASSITVTTYDGATYAARLVGSDERNDIAVLKIEAEGLRPVTLGSSDELSVGEDVVAIGNPLGELTFSLTKGVVSALGREVTMSSGVTMSLIQTDCAINSGNSGGALFNLNGEVVGITNAKYSSGSYSSAASIDNIGFAIPINSVRDIVTSIIERGGSSGRYNGV